MIPIAFRESISPELQTEIAAFVSQYRTLERLIASALPVVTMVSQDEFTVDLVLRYRDEVYLAYDMT